MTKQAKNYLILTYIISWPLWLMLSYLLQNEFINFGETTFWILFIIGGNGPLIAALLSKKYFGEKNGNRNFIEQIFKVEKSATWYIVIIFVLGIVGLFIWIVNSLSKGLLQPFFSQPPYLLIILLPMMIIGGGLEELGWRGVLLPELNKKLPISIATLVVGVFWGLWHLPLWLVEGLYFENVSFLAYFISYIAVSFFYTVVYMDTKSIFMCIFLHSLYNSYFEILNPLTVSEFFGSAIDVIVYLTVFLIYYKIVLGKDFGVVFKGFPR